ncbi:hypothetical protein MMC22_002820 [Lobaria immixta]|nr:hypothetical protein [Lobaria immixta]
MESTHDTLPDTGVDSDHPLSIDSNDESSTTENYTENDDPNTPEEQSPWHISPPPENQYDNAELADYAIHTWTREHTFELVQKKTFKRKGNKPSTATFTSGEKRSIPESLLLSCCFIVF